MVAIKGITIDCLDDGPTLEKGGYIFYSGFKYGSLKTNVLKRIKVNQFFFVRISRHDDPCIGELVSIWKDKYRDTMLASVRLYFLPEQTPDGRQSNHGQHEVLAASEPVILRLNDLVSWITEEVDWVTGLEVPYHSNNIDPPAFTLPFLNLINDANKQIPSGHNNSNHYHQQQQQQQHQNEQQTNYQNDQQQQQQQKPRQQSNGETNEHKNCSIDDKLDTNSDQDKVIQSEDQQQSTSSSSSTTLTSSSSSQANNNNLIGVIDSQIENQSVIVILSYPQYCRYRALLKKMEENVGEKENVSGSMNCQSTDNPTNSSTTKASSPTPTISTMKTPITCNAECNNINEGTINKTDVKSSQCIRILFCRETFEHDGLLNHEFNCEYLAPKLKGRPRKRGNHHTTNSLSAAKTSSHSSSSAQDSDTSEENSGKQENCRVRLPRKSTNSANSKVKSSSSEVDCAFQVNNNRCNNNKHKSKPSAMSSKLAEKCLKNESEFMKQLNKFMKERNTPITRIPHLGFKKIDLFYLFTFTQKLGGYEKITQNKEWKKVYDELGGDPRSTSAATCTRRHFERLLLPFERHLAEARGIVVNRRSTRGRSISPMFPVESPTPGKGDDDYQSVGSANSTDHSRGRPRRRRHHRQGVRQSKRLKGAVSSTSPTPPGASSSSSLVINARSTNVTSSNASSSATDDDECDSLMSQEDEAVKDEEDGNVNCNNKLKSRSSKSTKERSSKMICSGDDENQLDSSSSSFKNHETNNDNDAVAVDENDDDDDNKNNDNGTVNKDKSIKDDSCDSLTLEGKGCTVKCKSRSPSVENNLNSSNVKRSQSERKFVVKIDGLSTGDPKVRNEEEKRGDGTQRVTIKGKSLLSSTKTEAKEDDDESDIQKDLLIKESSITGVKIEKCISDAGDDGDISTAIEKESDLTGEPNVDLIGKQLSESSMRKVKPFEQSANNVNDGSSNLKNDNMSDEDASDADQVNNNNNNNSLTTRTKDNCDNDTNNNNVNVKFAVSNLSMSDKINEEITCNANNHNNVASPLSSISTLISAMDAAKQQQQIHLARDMKLENADPNINNNNNINVQSILNGVKKCNAKSNNNNSIFNNINSRSSSTSLPSSGRPSVIHKTPLKPCVKVVPTYKDNPIEGLIKDNSLLKKITIPPIAHAASFIPSPTWFNQQQIPFTTGSSTSTSSVTLAGNKNHNKNTNNNNFSSSSLKRKVAPSSIQGTDSMLLPLDLSCKKRIIEVASDHSKVVTPKGKVTSMEKLGDDGNDDNCPPTILDLSSKVRFNESSSSSLLRVTAKSMKSCSSGNSNSSSLSSVNLPQLTNNSLDHKNSSSNNVINRSSHLHHHHQQQTQQSQSQSHHLNNKNGSIPVPKVPKSNANVINERANMKSNSSKSGNQNQSQQQPTQPQQQQTLPHPPPSRHINPSPLPVSTPIPVASSSNVNLPSTTPLAVHTNTATVLSSSNNTKHQQLHSSSSSSSSSSSMSTSKNVSNQASSSNRSQTVKSSPSPNALKLKECKSNYNSGSGLKDLNLQLQQQQQQWLMQTHLNSLSNQQLHSHHQRRQHQQQQPPSSHHLHQQQQQQLPLLSNIPFPSSDNRDVQSKLQSANTLNQLRAMVTPENIALAQHTIAQEIAFREMERIHPNLAKQMSSAAAAAAVLGYPPGFHPIINSVHRSTVPSSSPSISEYNPTLPSFLPFLNSFMPQSTAPTGTGPGAPPHTVQNTNGTMGMNNVNAVAAAAAALASGHFFNPAALAAGQPGANFSPLELLGDERFSAAAAAAATAENDARWRGWFE